MYRGGGGGGWGPGGGGVGVGGGGVGVGTGGGGCDQQSRIINILSQHTELEFLNHLWGLGTEKA